VGGCLTGLAWILNSFASSLAMLYVAQIIGGLGAGAVYGTCVGMHSSGFLIGVASRRQQ
jgi:MFS transporter, OFA family, oxalate/formate antiporter